MYGCTFVFKTRAVVNHSKFVMIVDFVIPYLRPAVTFFRIYESTAEARPYRHLSGDFETCVAVGQL